jgi:alkanesulfonate monooxygenase SsuD/methylene tetrahydromethanopterin reductase-like flavin-dependent oxidoreductase (luciferase family)
MPFEGRFAKLRHDMDVIRRLGNGERVGDAHLNPWERFRPGPRFLLAAWGGGTMLERAVSEYDGWLCSAGRTTVGTIVDGLARYRDLGGTRAVVASTRCAFTGERRSIEKDDPFSLVCSPAEAEDRLNWLADLGFDDVLINVDDGRRRGPFMSDLSHDRLLQLRELYVPAPAYSVSVAR